MIGKVADTPLCEITGPAGSALDYVEALKLIREKLTGQPYPHQERNSE